MTVYLNKQAVFMPLFVLLVMVVSAYLAYTYINQQTISKQNTIIDSSKEIIGVYEEAESSMFYLESATKTAAWKTLNDISAQGSSNFDEIFIKKLKENMIPYLIKPNLPKEYEFKLIKGENLEIIGTPKSLTTIEKYSQYIDVKYTMSQNFKVAIHYQIGKNLKLIDDIKACRTKILIPCLNELGIKYVIENDNIIVDIQTTKNLNTNRLIIPVNPLKDYESKL